jgi:hypothetical protein
MSTKQKGIFYCYPECCIDNFITVRPNKRTRTQRMASKTTAFVNTGFIPCHKCSIKILNNKATIESLIKNRICRHKFPIGKHMRRCRIKKLEY